MSSDRYTAFLGTGYSSPSEDEDEDYNTNTSHKLSPKKSTRSRVVPPQAILTSKTGDEDTIDPLERFVTNTKSEENTRPLSFTSNGVNADGSLSSSHNDTKESESYEELIDQLDKFNTDQSPKKSSASSKRSSLIDDLSASVDDFADKLQPEEQLNNTDKQYQYNNFIPDTASKQPWTKKYPEDEIDIKPEDALRPRNTDSAESTVNNAPPFAETSSIPIIHAQGEVEDDDSYEDQNEGEFVEPPESSKSLSISDYSEPLNNNTSAIESPMTQVDSDVKGQSWKPTEDEYWNLDQNDPDDGEAPVSSKTSTDFADTSTSDHSESLNDKITSIASPRIRAESDNMDKIGQSWKPTEDEYWKLNSDSYPSDNESPTRNDKSSVSESDSKGPAIEREEEEKLSESSALSVPNPVSNTGQEIWRPSGDYSRKTSVATDYSRRPSAFDYSTQSDMYSFRANDDQFSFFQNDDAASAYHKRNDSTGSLSTGIYSSSIRPDDEDDGNDDCLTEQHLHDQENFKNGFIRANTRDTVRTNASSYFDSGITATGSNMFQNSKRATKPYKVDSMLLDNDPLKKKNLMPLEENEELDTSYEYDSTTDTMESSIPEPTERRTSGGSAHSAMPLSSSKTDLFKLETPKLPTIDITKIINKPTSDQRLSELRKHREELLTFDTGLTTYLKQTIKLGSVSFSNIDSQLGPNVLNAYKNSANFHSSQNVAANNLMRSSTALKEKGRKIFSKIHLK